MTRPRGPSPAATPVASPVGVVPAPLLRAPPRPLRGPSAAPGRPAAAPTRGILVLAAPGPVAGR